MGDRGPIPNRDEDLARDRSRRGGNAAPDATKGVALPATPPEADPEWHDIAKMMWDGMLVSGQKNFYQQSDWAYAYSVCDDLSYYKKSGRRSAQLLSAIDSALARLMVTEGDRRRARIELEPIKAPETTQGQAAVADYAQGLSLVPPLEETS